MTNRIKGIAVELGGDTTKLQTALKGVNSEIRNTQLQLQDVEKLKTMGDNISSAGTKLIPVTAAVTGLGTAAIR